MAALLGHFRPRCMVYAFTNSEKARRRLSAPSQSSERHSRPVLHPPLNGWLNRLRKRVQRWSLAHLLLTLLLLPLPLVTQRALICCSNNMRFRAFPLAKSRWYGAPLGPSA
eukprot:250796-Pyramimonas_sp.AAC.2